MDVEVNIPITRYLLFAFNICYAAGCIAILVIAGTIHYNIYFYDFFPDSVSHPSITLIVSSCVLLVISGLGYFGAIKEMPWMLKTFAVLVGGLLTVQLAGGVLALSQTAALEGGLRTNMEAMQLKYPENGTEKAFWDDLQREFHCCGVDSYTEWVDLGLLSSPPQSCTCRTSAPCQANVYSDGCHARLGEYVHVLEVTLGCLALAFLAFHMFSIMSSLMLASAIENK